MVDRQRQATPPALLPPRFVFYALYADEDPSVGILPPNGNEQISLQQSMKTMYVENDPNSQGPFIHCSGSCLWAFFHAVFLSPKPRAGSVAMVDVEKLLTTDATVQILHSNDPRMTMHLDSQMMLYGKGYQEVLIRGCIVPEAITMVIN